MHASPSKKYKEIESKKRNFFYVGGRHKTKILKGDFSKSQSYKKLFLPFLKTVSIFSQSPGNPRETKHVRSKWPTRYAVSLSRSGGKWSSGVCCFQAVKDQIIEREGRLYHNPATYIKLHKRHNGTIAMASFSGTASKKSAN